MWGVRTVRNDYFWWVEILSSRLQTRLPVTVSTQNPIMKRESSPLLPSWAASVMSVPEKFPGPSSPDRRAYSVQLRVYNSPLHFSLYSILQVSKIKHTKHVSDSFRKRKVLDKAETKSFDIVLEKNFSVLKTISLSMKKIGENMRERFSLETSVLHPRHHYQIPKSFWLNFELQEFVILLLKLFNLR